MKANTPKYRRESPEVRREGLVDAALRCLARDGHDGVSVRRIAAEAGVSVGLINHYYASIDELIAHAFETLARDLVRKLLDRVGEAPSSPRARLTAFFQASYSPLLLDPNLLGVWVVFWSMLKHSPAMQAAQQRTWSEYREVLEQHLAAYAAEVGRSHVNVRLVALGLSAMLDGSWLEWCLDPTSFRPEEGIALCEAWVDGLKSGIFDGLPT
ncbi:MAG TPA: TetR family transcriptional regulator C-terminal domain-containing protein [Stellaceae bacterium]|nr:TetR family transcriptional regulator C-terminal domain-containing protein [Stellaceae bacterium]